MGGGSVADGGGGVNEDGGSVIGAVAGASSFVGIADSGAIVPTPGVTYSTPGAAGVYDPGRTAGLAIDATVPQFPPKHGMGKSSHVSHCVHPAAPVIATMAPRRRLFRTIPVSFP